MAEKEIPTYQTQQAVNANVGMIDFEQAMSSYGAATNTLSTYGNMIAQKASNAFSEEMGYQQGQNPGGTLLPAITKSDEHFVAAYTLQAKATLGNELNQMMQDGQTAMARMPNITPKSLQEFNENMSKGASKIIERAPKSIQPELFNHFNSQMMRSSGHLNTRMATEQKQEALWQQARANNNNINTVMGLAVDGQFEDADRTTKNTIAENNARVETGQITPKQRDIANDALKQALINGVFINGADKAREQNKLSEYMNNLSGNRPEGIPYDKWEAVKSAVQSHVLHVDKLKQKENDRLNGLIDQSLANNRPPDPSILEQAYNTMSSGAYNEVLAKIDRKMSQVNKKNNDYVNINANAHDPSFMSKLTPKEQENWYQQKFAHLTEDPNNPLDPTDADISIASNVPVPLNVLKDKYNAMANSPNAVNIQAALKLHAALNDSGKVPFTAKSQAVMANFLQFNRGDPDEAAQQAYDVANNQTEEQVKLRHESFAKFRRESLKTDKTKGTFAASVFGTNLKKYPGYNLHVDHALNVMQNFHMLTNDISRAQKLTQDYFQNNFDTYKFGNVEQYGFYPTMKAMGLDKDTGNKNLVDFVTKLQMTEQVSKNFQAIKELYDQGLKSSWYELKPSDSFNKSNKNYNALVDLASGKKEANHAVISEIKNRIANAGNVGPLKVIQHFKDGSTEELTLTYESSNLLFDSSHDVIDPSTNEPMVDPKTGQNVSKRVVGPYNLVLTNQNGQMVSHPYVPNKLGQGLHFVFNATDAQNSYALVTNALINQQQRSTQQEQIIADSKRRKERPKDLEDAFRLAKKMYGSNE